MACTPRMQAWQVAPPWGKDYTAQSFQVKIGYYTSFYSKLITDPIEIIYFICGSIKLQQTTTQRNPIHFILGFAVQATHVAARCHSNFEKSRVSV